MVLIYRTAGPWGAGKGANLIAGEVDGNFFDLNQRVLTIEDNIPDAALGIAYFSVTGAAFYVHMTDGTIQGPYSLPQQVWTFRGEWSANKLYNVNDVITGNGSTYMVLLNHTSGSGAFDAGANDGVGHSYYGLLLENPSGAIPEGGLAGQYLVKTSSSVDYQVNWQTPIVFPAQALRSASGLTYTLSLADIAGYVRCLNASGCTITVPTDATLPFPIASEISFRQCTETAVTVKPQDATVILDTYDGYFSAVNGCKTGRNGAVITIKKIDVNHWDVFGLMQPVS